MKIRKLNQAGKKASKGKLILNARRNPQDPALGYSRKHFVHSDKRNKPMTKHQKSFLVRLLRGE